MTERAQEFTQKLTALLEEYNASIDAESDYEVSIDIYVGNEIITLDEVPTYRPEIDKDSKFKVGRAY